MNRTLKNILLTPMNVLYRINPKLELKLMFYLKHGYRLNLNEPKTYNEKLNWMKLYYRNELMPICADKYTVRQYVKDCGCGEILNELYWQGFDAKDIPFDDLPKQFVIKVTHGSGNNIICKDKDKLNKKKTIRKLNRWLKQKYLPCYGEWFYGKVKPRIIIEKFLTEDGSEPPEDYKLYCFNNINGRHDVGIIAVHKGRFSGQRTKTIYDSQWKLKSEVIFGDPPDPVNVIRNLENMKRW